MSSNLDPQTYIDGLKAELDNEKRAGRDTAAILAELKRVGGLDAKVERTVRVRAGAEQA